MKCAVCTCDIQVSEEVCLEEHPSMWVHKLCCDKHPAKESE